MTEQFKTTAEYRFWTVRHDLDAHPSYMLAELKHSVTQALHPNEREFWDRVCDDYEKREFPLWFVKEVGVGDDY